MNFHLVTQGKGGVGKSVIANLLAQYIKSIGRPLRCIDTDPVNKTFSGFSALDVQTIELIENDEINIKKFDFLYEIGMDNEADIVVDNGAASFLPLNNYMLEIDFPEMIMGTGQTLFIHVPVAGGNLLLDTLNGFAGIASQYPKEVKIIVWVNENRGPVEHEGKPFEKLKAYTENKENVDGIIILPKLSKTFHTAFTDLLSEGRILEQGINDPSLVVPDQQRLKMIQRKYFQPIELAMMHFHGDIDG